MKIKHNKVLNEAPDKKQIGKFQVDLNAIDDQGNGLVMFKTPLTITDDKEQWNGTKYDMKTYDVSEYSGQLTADHRDTIQSILGKVIGVNLLPHRVTIDGIQFAVNENPLALFAYNMLVGKYLTDFSTETIGPWPDDEDRTYYNAKLVGLSAVVVGNNKRARINEITVNSIEQAEALGLDATELRELLKSPLDTKNKKPYADVDMTLIRIKNTKSFPVAVAYNNADGKPVEEEVKAGASVDVPETEAAQVEETITKAEEPKAPEDKKDGDNSTSAIEKAINAAVKPLVDQVAKLEKQVFDNAATEPGFKKSETPTTITKNKYESMDYKERHGLQILSAWDGLKGGKSNALDTLSEVNKVNFEALQKAGIVANSITIADMGNFVISPELLKDIEGFRSSFKDILAAVTYRDTLSTQMAWLTRSGDINMQEVEFCDDNADGNLKPISEYGATIQTSNLSELAAVTPVCNAATRFLAVDLLSDVAQGYRTDYDRKRAQLLIARLQQATDTTNNHVNYNSTTGVTSLKTIIDLAVQLAEISPEGTFVFNYATYGTLLKQAVAAGINTEVGFGMFTTGAIKTLVGRPYIVVPNELMPSLDTVQTKTFVVDGANVTINTAIFYGDLATFTGRTSGNLNYDFSTSAAYEDGDVVKSAFQRNELVLRGSFFRGGAVRDPQKIIAMRASGVS